VSAPDETVVTDKKFIKQWVSMLTAKEYKNLREFIENISKKGLPKQTLAKCQECEHEWETNIGVDPSNFFDMR
jgi:hypothetical protein